MPHLKITNGQPETYSIGQLRRDNPNTSFSKVPSNALLADWGVYPYTMQDRPVYDHLTQTLKQTALTEVNGAWVQGWEVNDLPAEIIRARLDEASCSPMQGILALGETQWAKVITYRDTYATWAEKVVIDSALDWQRGSENISFFMHLLNLSPEETDDLFRVAAQINA